MYLITPSTRPAASFTCSRCRAINGVEERDIETREITVSLKCVSCSFPQPVETLYMAERLRRDQAAA